jgi:NADPH:quinone reductase-like Zn-dependent oxidoreductase
MPMTKMMKAVSIDNYGDNSVVRLVELPCSTPGPGKIRVAVRAAGVNPVDWKIRNGAGQRMGMTLPIRMGSEISGVVDAVGEGVDILGEGDEVFGIVSSGGFAEYVVVEADDLVRKPERLDFIHSAAIPLGGLTAWQSMIDAGGLKAGDRLLITGGSGGVGSLAIQIAKAKGAHVTAMASSRNEAFVRSLGVDAFVDYTAQPFEQVVSDMDVVFDTIGGETFKRAFRTVRPGGVLVTAVAFPGEDTPWSDVRVERIYTKANADQLSSLRSLVDEGRLTPHVGTVYSFEDVTEALELSESGRAQGKIILAIA